MPISVLVVGAGPVSLMVALRLAQANIRVTCLEAQSSLAKSPRAMVYHPTVANEFERVGILKAIREQGARAQSVCWRVSKTDEIIAKLEMSAEDGINRESLVIGQDDLSEIILEHLAKYEQCDILYGHRVVSLEKCTAIDDTTCHKQPQLITVAGEDRMERRFAADYIIAADGGRSTIRNLLDIPFEGETYPEQLIAANVIISQVPDTWSDANSCVDSWNHWGLIARIRNDLWRMSYNEEQDLSEAQIRERLPNKLS